VNIPKVRRHAESIAALAATEHQFILAKQSVIAAAALAAAVKEEVESHEVLILMKKISYRIECDVSEIFLYLSYISNIEDIVTVETEHIFSSPFNGCSAYVSLNYGSLKSSLNAILK
jgi:hypothetical protein